MFKGLWGRFKDNIAMRSNLVQEIFQEDERARDERQVEIKKLEDLVRRIDESSKASDKCDKENKIRQRGVDEPTVFAKNLEIYKLCLKHTEKMLQTQK